MSNFTPRPPAFAFGIASHLLYFKTGEHHMSGPWLTILVPVAWTIITVLLHHEETLLVAIKDSTLLACSFALGLYGSMITYRIFFHPLRHFPGPKLARVSKFWHAAKLSDLKNYVLVEELQHQYGEIVRIGPNEVVVFRPDAIPAIHGPGSKCTKAPWYDMLQKDSSMHATRNPVFHATRRRIWDQGFSLKALKSYQTRVNDKVTLLAANIARSAGEPINCTRLFLFFGFDVMGEVAFGEGFGMLESDTVHPIMEIMRSGIYIIGRFTPITWLVTILASLPGANADWAKLERFAQKQVLKRMEMERDNDDIDMHWLVGDAVTMIVAGSDTVSITLTFLFYNLALFPDCVSKLRKELTGVDIADNRALQSLPYLSALINETLRIHPPAPTSPLRLTPPEGLQIGPYFIPGGVTISVPAQNLGRLETSYTKAHEFIPERWLPGSDMIKDRSGFAPFLLGKHSCVGKHLAMMELRLVAARLVTMYDFTFAEGYDQHEVLDMKDCFTAIPGTLKLAFTPRA
ncbi:putative benzoate 4-monooxygenase cytochrome P450 [Clohesyomyces aquaticus]|uniref:Putative benzoate 4-monooxygenase cytochrome P450 n=1 Tax=Clohesyomyces aquaticus TaxID=1231657 RepID=A0A1Y1Z4J8_9PLEO|nr:putative benzoate 4-monooxygenase cytochrome P450 [Clohesyomyces aquaticus]